MRENPHSAYALKVNNRFYYSVQKGAILSGWHLSSAFLFAPWDEKTMLKIQLLCEKKKKQIKWVVVKVSE